MSSVGCQVFIDLNGEDVYKRQIQVGIFLIGLVLSLLFSAYPTIVITIATLMTLAMEVHFAHFYMTQTKKFATLDWELY